MHVVRKLEGEKRRKSRKEAELHVREGHTVDGLTDWAECA